MGAIRGWLNSDCAVKGCNFYHKCLSPWVVIPTAWWSVTSLSQGWQALVCPSRVPWWKAVQWSLGRRLDWDELVRRCGFRKRNIFTFSWMFGVVISRCIFMSYPHFQWSVHRVRLDPRVVAIFWSSLPIWDYFSHRLYGKPWSPGSGAD